MPTEIEKKFLITNELWRSEAKTIVLTQGYIYSTPECLVRIRIADDKAFLTVKGKKNDISRPEFEYSIPMQDAQEMLQTMTHEAPIRKNRHLVQAGKHTWEIDEFLDDNAGLIVAEIELNYPKEEFIKPEWVGEEVTYDKRYRHRALVDFPFKLWSEEDKKACSFY